MCLPLEHCSFRNAVVRQPCIAAIAAVAARGGAGGRRPLVVRIARANPHGGPPQEDGAGGIIASPGIARADAHFSDQRLKFLQLLDVRHDRDVIPQVSGPAPRGDVIAAPLPPCGLNRLDQLGVEAARRKVSIGRIEGEHPEPELLEVVRATQPSGRLSGALYRRNEQPDEHPDDRDHHQHLDERKTASACCQRNWFEWHSTRSGAAPHVWARLQKHHIDIANECRYQRIFPDDHIRKSSPSTPLPQSQGR